MRLNTNHTTNTKHATNLKQTFKTLPYNNLKHGEWIRHLDVKTDHDVNEHNKCLIYHEKGTRGKLKTVETTWTDIEKQR